MNLGSIPFYNIDAGRMCGQKRIRLDSVAPGRLAHPFGPESASSSNPSLSARSIFSFESQIYEHTLFVGF
jgi:hypothetical protein